MATNVFIPLHPRAQDLNGLRFGKWTILGYVGQNRWLCQCECGKLFKHTVCNLNSGKTSACRKCAFFARRRTERLHPLEYSVWRRVKDRCLNPNATAYHRYGGRGIKICQRWKDSFVNFFADMGKRPSKKHTIDRIDNNGNYEPGNCRWATRKEQMQHTSITRLVTLNGETLCLKAWGERLGLAPSSVYYRLRRGWSMERTLTEARQGKHATRFKGDRN